MKSIYTHPLAIFIVTVLSSVIVSAVITYTVNKADPSEIMNEQIAAYYAASTATLVSPHSIREKMDRGYHDYIVVDTRAQEDYVKGHVSGAINIDSNLGADEVVRLFTELGDSKPILIYCYSASCMNGRKVGNLLAQHGIFVHEMTVGYNEWEYSLNSWNYPDEWDSLDIEEYITRGEEPGAPTVKLENLTEGCGITGELSC